MKELRILNESQLCVRSEENGGNLVTGYASVFNQESKLIAENGKIFYEIILEGAFDEALARSDLNVIANRDHDNKQILARTASGTLSLSIDNFGLQYQFVSPNTTLGRDTVELLNRGDLRESSFRYIVQPSGVEWKYGEDRILRRYIKNITKILDVAIVVNGAFANTDVSARGINIDEIERVLQSDELKRQHEFDAYYEYLKTNFYGSFDKT